jgi:hypothetical protein
MRDDEIETPFAVFFCGTGQGPFAMYRRSVYEQTTGWETAFWPHEDTDMFCQMPLQSKVHFLPDRLYLKRVHRAQGMYGARVQEAYGKFREKWDPCWCFRSAFASAGQEILLRHPSAVS